MYFYIKKIMFSFVFLLISNQLLSAFDTFSEQLLDPQTNVFDITFENGEEAKNGFASKLLLPKSIIEINGAIEDGKRVCRHGGSFFQYGDKCFEYRCPVGTSESNGICTSLHENCLKQKNNCSNSSALLEDGTLQCLSSTQCLDGYTQIENGECRKKKGRTPDSTTDKNKMVELQKLADEKVKYSELSYSPKIEQTTIVDKKINDNTHTYCSYSVNGEKRAVELDENGKETSHFLDSMLFDKNCVMTFKNSDPRYGNIKSPLKKGESLTTGLGVYYNPTVTVVNNGKIKTNLKFCHYKTTDPYWPGSTERFYLAGSTLPTNDMMATEGGTTTDKDCNMEVQGIYYSAAPGDVTSLKVGEKKKFSWLGLFSGGIIFFENLGAVPSTGKQITVQVKVKKMVCPNSYKETGLDGNKGCVKMLYCNSDNETLEEFEGKKKCTKFEYLKIPCAVGSVYDSRINKCVKNSNHSCNN